MEYSYHSSHDISELSTKSNTNRQDVLSDITSHIQSKENMMYNRDHRQMIKYTYDDEKMCQSEPENDSQFSQQQKALQKFNSYRSSEHRDKYLDTIDEKSYESNDISGSNIVYDMTSSMRRGDFPSNPNLTKRLIEMNSKEKKKNIWKNIEITSEEFSSHMFSNMDSSETVNFTPITTPDLQTNRYNKNDNPMPKCSDYAKDE